ncbi:MAG: type II toxin-antitoxin system RelE/ParE family toxin [Oscillospiraceae bacterium]|nr:type II toxin-antitoxin system RelE/ParE family toxin [Oscillospiraceae bacterium]
MLLRKQDFDIDFYDLADGTRPAEVFIESLPPKMMAKVLRSINMLRLNGYELREPYSKHLDDGIFEIRAKVGKDISRVLYFFIIGRKAILTHGFIKKTQKTPPIEIDRAKKYREDYLSRKEQNNESVG